MLDWALTLRKVVSLADQGYCYFCSYFVLCRRALAADHVPRWQDGLQPKVQRSSDRAEALLSALQTSIDPMTSGQLQESYHKKVQHRFWVISIQPLQLVETVLMAVLFEQPLGRSFLQAMNSRP